MTGRIATASLPLAIGFVVAACATATAVDGAVLLGVIVRDDALEITAVSTGCTRAGDFEFVVDRVDRAGEVGTVRLTVTRTKPDLCRKMPEAATFRYPLADVGLRPDDAIRLQNELMSIKPRRRR